MPRTAVRVGSWGVTPKGGRVWNPVTQSPRSRGLASHKLASGLRPSPKTAPFGLVTAPGGAGWGPRARVSNPTVWGLAKVLRRHLQTRIQAVHEPALRGRSRHMPPPGGPYWDPPQATRPHACSGEPNSRRLAGFPQHFVLGPGLATRVFQPLWGGAAA